MTAIVGAAIEVARDAADAARLAADVVADTVRARPDAVIGFATGRTPRALYAQLARRVARRELDLRGIRVVALDEYVGVAPDDPRSFAAYLDAHVIRPLHIDPRRVSLLDGSAASDEVLAERCRAYDRLLDAAGVDLQIVGIGRNGHIGFSEPGTPFETATHLARLTEATRRDNADAFGGDPRRVPERALTQGPATIARARTILLVASGDGKADAVAAAFDGPIDPACPASLLQRHPRVRAVLDPAAATGLSRRGRGVTPDRSAPTTPRKADR